MCSPEFFVPVYLSNQFLVRCFSLHFLNSHREFMNRTSAGMASSCPCPQMLTASARTSQGWSLPSLAAFQPHPQLRPSPFITRLLLPKRDCSPCLPLPFSLQVPGAKLTCVQDAAWSLLLPSTREAIQTLDQKLLPSSSQGGGNEELCFREQHF